MQWGRHETNRALVRRDGTRLQANLALRPISDAAKKVMGFGLIAHDIDRSRRIAAAVLFSSGYFEGALVGKGELETNVQFLPKPYQKQELVQKIEEVLNGL